MPAEPVICTSISLSISNGQQEFLRAARAALSNHILMPASLNELSRQAQALKGAGRMDDALVLYRRAVDQNPASAVAEHNLAGALGDAGLWGEAEPHILQAFAKGLRAPEAWLVRGRCAQALGRFDEAESGFLEALRLRPDYIDVHRELVQLRWMRGGDIDTGLANLNQTLLGAPGDLRLISLKAQALRNAGRHADALTLLSAAIQAAPNQPGPITAAAQTATALRATEEAVALAERAIALAPQENVVRATLTEAYLLAGRAEDASNAAAVFLRDAPLNQNAIALQATAWRLLGDPRYKELYDYQALVGDFELMVPRGWPNLQAYLADLGAMLGAQHRYANHPFSQSILHGTQAPNILQLDHPAARALPEALGGPIQTYLAALGRGRDPLRARNTGAYRFHGMWSIRAKAGGFHINHVHPEGWISSACYVDVPRDMSGREGWIKFGEPGTPTTPPLKAEYAIEPAPGKLVLFPSYMWHGTVPFTGEGARLTFAFDLLPA